MTSCRCRGTEEQFNAKWAEKELKRYRRRGPEATSRILLDSLRETGMARASLLDVGGGIGAIHHALLGREVATAVHVDAASALLDAARREARRLGNGGGVDFIHADFVEAASDLPPSDVVTMARVVCCYEDYATLLARACEKAKRFLGISYPRDRWYVRAAMALGNFFLRLRGRSFRAFVHPVSEMEARIEAAGFESRSARDTFFWRVHLFARAPEGRAPPSLPSGPLSPGP